MPGMEIRFVEESGITTASMTRSHSAADRCSLLLGIAFFQTSQIRRIGLIHRARWHSIVGYVWSCVGVDIALKKGF